MEINPTSDLDVVAVPKPPVPFKLKLAQVMLIEVSFPPEDANALSEGLEPVRESVWEQVSGAITHRQDTHNQALIA